MGFRVLGFRGLGFRFRVSLLGIIFMVSCRITLENYSKYCVLYRSEETAVSFLVSLVFRFWAAGLRVWGRIQSLGPGMLGFVGLRIQYFRA